MSAPEPLSEQRRAELRAAAVAASSGPWSADVMGSEGYAVNGGRDPKRLRRTLVARCGYEAWDIDRANAEYIAAADPSTVAALLTERDALAAEVARLRAITERPDPRRWVSVEDANRVLAEERAAHEATAAALNDARAITEAAERVAAAWRAIEAVPVEATSNDVAEQREFRLAVYALADLADPVRLPEPEKDGE